MFTLQYKVLFMTSANAHLDTLKDIRRMMNRSSRFISLSGLSGVAAGVWALIGAFVAWRWLSAENTGTTEEWDLHSYLAPARRQLVTKFVILAAAVAGLSLLSALYFTWRRAGKNKVPLWDVTTRQLLVNTLVPFVSGGIFIFVLLQYHLIGLIAPCCLIFYGLALVSGSKYTLSDIRSLGVCEIVIGLISTQFIGLGLYFWALGFGVMHIVYGLLMWWKYERNEQAAEGGMQ